MNIPSHRSSSRTGRWFLSPAMVVAIIALVAALGGSALAVSAAKNSVTTKSIKNGAVKTKKLADGAVSATKLAGGAVTADKVADGAITTGKLANGSVSEAKLADGSVSGAKLADGSVSAGKLGADSVTDGALAADSVGNDELASESVSVGKIEPGALGASRFYEATAVQIDFPSVAGNSCTADQPAGFENLQATDRIVVSSPAGPRGSADRQDDGAAGRHRVHALQHLDGADRSAEPRLPDPRHPLAKQLTFRPSPQLRFRGRPGQLIHA